MTKLTRHEINVLVGYLIAWYHHTHRPIPKGLAPQSGQVGVVKRKMIREYQRALKVKVTGEFDTNTQRLLTPVDPRAHKAARSMSYCHWGTVNHRQFHYAQDRPIHSPPPVFLYTLPRVRDCSGFAFDAVYIGGFNPVTEFAHDSGFGNTDSILAWASKHGKFRSIELLRQADLIVYSNPGHVVIVTSPHHANPDGAIWAASDGHEGAPAYVTHQQELASHPGPFHGVAVD